MEEQEIQDIKRKKRYLKRYRKNNECIARLERKIDTLNHKIKSVKSSNFSGMPRGSVPITVEDMIADKADLEDRVKRLKQKRGSLKKQILEEIDSLEDIRYVEVLEGYFIDCLSLEDIADQEGYTVRHTYRLYSEAVEILALNRQ